MTTISRFPEEILLYIFECLDRSDLKQCQKVCQSWYPSAHYLFLEEISIFDIKQFIRSIDANPANSYLRAVKEITIYPGTAPTPITKPYRFTEEVAQKLFCRFLNLKSVQIHDSSFIYDDLNDDICKTILQNCPQLTTFAVYLTKYQRWEVETPDRYLDMLHKLRLLLTQFDLANVYYGSHRPRKNPIQYLKSFPRLTIIQLIPHYLDNFKKLLPVITELRNIKVVDFKNDNPAADTENFAEEYLATISKDKQDQLLKNLSNVTALTVKYRRAFNISSNKFISEYFNKLDRFVHHSCYTYRNFTQEERTSFCQHIIKLACSANHLAYVFLSDIKLADLEEVLPNIAPKVFDSIHRNKVLELFLTDHRFFNISVTSSKQRSLRKIMIDIPNQLSLDDIIASIITTMAPISIVNNLIIDLDKFEDTVPTDFYYDILDMIPSLKSVVVDVPTTCEIGRQQQTRIYPLVEELAVRSRSNVDQCQALLYEFFTRFPNVNSLFLFYFCGTFCEEKRQVQLDLANCTLEKLTLDITPIKSIWNKHRNKAVFTSLRFIVVQVGQQMYKVPLAWRLPCTRVTLNDLEGFTRGSDYLTLKITVGSLKQLHVHYEYGYKIDSWDYYMDMHKSYITVFNNDNH